MKYTPYWRYEMGKARYRRKRFGGRVVLEHRWVMECAIGRELRDDEEVRFVNGDSRDTRIENLVIAPVVGRRGKKGVVVDVPVPDRFRGVGTFDGMHAEYLRKKELTNE